jgi:hypothetical protein
MRLSALLLLPLLLLSACAESLKQFNDGVRVKQRHTMPGDWNSAGRTEWKSCRPNQLVYSAYWAEKGIPKVCPDEIDPNATLAVNEGVADSPSYRDLVVPATITGAFQAGGLIGLGAMMPKPENKVSVRQVNQYRNSTMYANPTPVPSWLGE